MRGPGVIPLDFLLDERFDPLVVLDTNPGLSSARELVSDSQLYLRENLVLGNLLRRVGSWDWF